MTLFEMLLAFFLVYREVVFRVERWRYIDIIEKYIKDNATKELRQHFFGKKGKVLGTVEI